MSIAIPPDYHAMDMKRSALDVIFRTDITQHLKPLPMTDKLWFRKSDGALVRPTMDEPRTGAIPDSKSYLANIAHTHWWNKHLASLPALTDIVVDAEYAKTLNDGWVKVERVRWEVFGNDDRWHNCRKESYDNIPSLLRRMVLLDPVENAPQTTRVYNGWNENKSRVAGIGGQLGQPADKAEEKEMVIPRPTLTDKELIDKVQDWVSKLCKTGGNAWTLRVPVDFNQDPDVLITELCRRLNEKPQAASGSDSVEFAEWLRTFEALSRENGQWVIESQVSSEKLYQHFLKSKQPTP